MAPSGAPDLKGDNLAKKYPDAPPDLKIIRAVSPGTTKLIRQMGVSLLHASASFGPNETVMKLGKIIPPNEVTDDTVRDMLFKEAELRRINGETTVRYEEEDEILAYAA
ncbi:hypothetical protein COY17_03390 [Candidatus Saccharibacteria bacterium CG_4_10_14_0_2_um_filter_52_9]|nr:MAG: hypothetical protein COY17_03390 [Candidatus Saccharibacteria bacterium CG_4_10_14_0_2_um_filter_52_9]